jgi:isoleucyl-tRNA synthetase
LEKKRAEKIIGSSLEAHIDIYLEKSILEKVKNYQMDEISITSSFSLHELNSSIEGFALEEISNVKISVSKTPGKKCQRCWKYKQELIRDEICNRCEDAIS